MEISGSHVLRFMPPITVTEAQIDEAMDIIKASLRLAEDATGHKRGPGSTCASA